MYGMRVVLQMPLALKQRVRVYALYSAFWVWTLYINWGVV